MKLDRLTLRVYLVGLLQMALTMLISLVLQQALMQSRSLGPFRGPVHLARFFVSSVTVHREDPARLQADAKRLRDTLGVQMSIYGRSGALLVSSAAPPFSPLSIVDQSRLAHEEGFSLADPGRLVVALNDGDAFTGYGVVAIPPPPGSPLRHLGPPPFFLQNLWFVLGLLSLAIVSVLFGRALAAPLSRLTAVARAFGEGDLKARAGFTRRDAFGDLAVAFDQMADRITQLLRSQKELLANVSHELRTPLSRIRVALDLATEGDAQVARIAHAEIAADLNELERLVEDVLAEVRLDLVAHRGDSAVPPLRLEPVALATLIGCAVDRFRSAHPQRKLLVELASALPIVRVDPTLLRRAIDNLLDNAQKYSEADTGVTLRAEDDGERVSIVIADQGIGIEASDLPLVATPFFRTDRSRARKTGGVGLGLSLARRIIEVHGGELRLASRIGIGTTVRICLPHPHAAAPTAGT